MNKNTFFWERRNFFLKVYLMRKMGSGTVWTRWNKWEHSNAKSPKKREKKRKGTKRKNWWDEKRETHQRETKAELWVYVCVQMWGKKKFFRLHRKISNDMWVCWSFTIYHKRTWIETSFVLFQQHNRIFFFSCGGKSPVKQHLAYENHTEFISTTTTRKTYGTFSKNYQPLYIAIILFCTFSIPFISFPHKCFCFGWNLFSSWLQFSLHFTRFHSSNPIPPSALYPSFTRLRVDNFVFVVVGIVSFAL